MINDTRPFPSAFAYCKRSKTGRWEGLGTRLHNHLITFLVTYLWHHHSIFIPAVYFYTESFSAYFYTGSWIVLSATVLCGGQSCVLVKLTQDLDQKHSPLSANKLYSQWNIYSAWFLNIHTSSRLLNLEWAWLVSLAVSYTDRNQAVCVCLGMRILQKNCWKCKTDLAILYNYALRYVVVV